MRKLSRRETYLAASCAILVLTGTLLQVLILPAVELRSDSLTRLAKFNQIQNHLDQMPSIVTRASTANRPPLRQWLTESAGLAGLDIRRLAPQGSAVSVSLEDVPFARLVGWLDQLSGPGQLQLLSAEIARRPEPGIVSAQLVLEAK